MTHIAILFACVPVAHFGDSVDWYGRLFGRPADVLVKDDEVMWRFADAAWLYVVVDEARAGHTLVTLCVPDLDGTVAEIGNRGITIGPVETVGDAGRKAPATDPDGNVVSFIEVTAPAG